MHGGWKGGEVVGVFLCVHQEAGPTALEFRYEHWNQL